MKHDPMITPDKTTYIFIEPNTPEWLYMWAELAQDELNTNLEEPETAHNDGEEWQYMGSETDGETAMHYFRHRNHPRTNRREYVSINSSIDLAIPRTPKAR